MGLSLEQKQATVSEVSAKLGTAQAVIVAEYRGLDVARVTQLRARARKSGLYLKVLKNTLARRAVKGTPFEKLAEQMSGPLMYGIADDPVAGAKVPFQSCVIVDAPMFTTTLQAATVAVVLLVTVRTWQ